MAEVPLEDVLNSAPDPETELFAINGIVVRDAAPESFRIYDRPGEPGTYLRLRTADVAEPLQELTRGEAAQLGFFGRKAHRVLLRLGASATRITTEPSTLG